MRDLPTLLLLLVLDRVPTFAVNCIDHAVTEVLFLTVYMCLSRNSSQFVLDYKPREVGTTTMMAPCLISAKSKLCGHTAACPFLPRIFSFLVSPYFCLVPLLFLLLGSLLHLKIAIPPPMAPKDHIFRKLSGNESTAPFLVRAQEALQMTRVVLQATRPGYPNILEFKVFQESPAMRTIGDLANAAGLPQVLPHMVMVTVPLGFSGGSWGFKGAGCFRADIQEWVQLSPSLNSGGGFHEGSGLEVSSEEGWGQSQKVAKKPLPPAYVIDLRRAGAMGLHK